MGIVHAGADPPVYDYINDNFGVANPLHVSTTAHEVDLHAQAQDYEEMPLDDTTIKVEASEAYGVCLRGDTTTAAQLDEGLNNHQAAVHVDDPSTAIDLKQNDAYTLEDTIKLKQNDAYTLEDAVTTFANESYNYSAKFNTWDDSEIEQNMPAPYIKIIPGPES